MKRLAVLALLLSACAPATAQLQVSVPSTASCTEGGTLTPILGIAVASVFDGDYGYAGAVTDALTDAGFRVVSIFDYRLIDKASISLDGSVSNWTSRSGEQSSKRVGKANLVVTDIATETPILRLEQKPASVVLQAPTKEAFVKGVAQSIQAKFCQLRD